MAEMVNEAKARVENVQSPSPAAGAAGSPGEPAETLGCCVLSDGSTVEGVTRLECTTVHKGVDWYPGPCGEKK